MFRKQLRVLFPDLRLSSEAVLKQWILNLDQPTDWSDMTECCRSSRLLRPPPPLPDKYQIRPNLLVTSFQHFHDTQLCVTDTVFKNYKLSK